MARNRNNQSNNDFKGFINYYPTAEDKKAVNSKMLTPTQQVEHLASLARQGIKVSISYLENGDCLILTLTNKDPGSPSQGYALSLRHVELDKLVSLSQHILDNVLNGEPWQDFENDSLNNW